MIYINDELLVRAAMFANDGDYSNSAFVCCSEEGTGLGLPLVKAMIELHGGSLTLKSAVDKGTEVTIVFPSERIILTVTALPSAA